MNWRNMINTLRDITSNILEYLESNIKSRIQSHLNRILLENCIANNTRLQLPTAHKRSLLVFSSFGSIFTNKFYLSGKYSFRLVATSPVRGTLEVIFRDDRRIQEPNATSIKFIFVELWKKSIADYR